MSLKKIEKTAEVTGCVPDQFSGFSISFCRGKYRSIGAGNIILQAIYSHLKRFYYEYLTSTSRRRSGSLVFVQGRVDTVRCPVSLLCAHDYFSYRQVLIVQGRILSLKEGWILGGDLP